MKLQSARLGGYAGLWLWLRELVRTVQARHGSSIIGPLTFVGGVLDSTRRDSRLLNFHRSCRLKELDRLHADNIGALWLSRLDRFDEFSSCIIRLGGLGGLSGLDGLDKLASRTARPCRLSFGLPWAKLFLAVCRALPVGHGYRCLWGTLLLSPNRQSGNLIENLVCGSKSQPNRTRLSQAPSCPPRI